MYSEKCSSITLLQSRRHPICKMILWCIAITNMPFSSSANDNDGKQFGVLPYECSEKFSGPNSGTVLCLNGQIGPRTADAIVKREGRISRLITNSEGGDADSAMMIGRRLFRDQSVLEVSEKCISACANYLVPAAESVVVQDYSFIAMHGSIPRGIVEYTQYISRTKGASKGNMEKSLEDFSKIMKFQLYNEVKYYFDVLRDDAYVTRYREQVRNAIVEQKLRCDEYGEFILILDKEYLDAFGIKSSGWGHNDHNKLILEIEKAFKYSNIIYGFRGDLVKLYNRPGKNCKIDAMKIPGAF